MLTLTELCKETNIARSTLYNWYQWERECGHEYPDAPKLPISTSDEEHLFHEDAIDELLTFKHWVQINRGKFTKISQKRNGSKRK